VEIFFFGIFVLLDFRSRKCVRDTRAEVKAVGCETSRLGMVSFFLQRQRDDARIYFETKGKANAARRPNNDLYTPVAPDLAL
jgi:hypothetical protein